MLKIISKSLHLPVADLGFPEVEAPTLTGRGWGWAPTHNFAKCSQKLHEIKIIWTGGRHALRPLRFANSYTCYGTDCTRLIYCIYH